MMYTIHMLPASFGDSLLIEYGKEEDAKYILIDGGPYFSFDDEWILALREVAPDLEELELLVVTHIDIDHIDGIIVLLNREELPFRIHEIWFNGWDQIRKFDKDNDLLGPKQGEYLSALIRNQRLPQNARFNGGPVVLDRDNIPKTLILNGGMKLTLLSPSQAGLQKLIRDWVKVVEEVGNADVWTERLREDTRYEYLTDSDLLGDIDIRDLQGASVRPDRSAANASSIAFIAEFNGKSVLFSGDAQSDQLDEAISHLRQGKERLQLDAWKLSHHGSKKSTLSFLMEAIDCKDFLISTDGKRYRHPDRETIALLFKHNGPALKFYFNYRTEYNSIWDDDELREDWKYETVYPEVEKRYLSVDVG